MKTIGDRIRKIRGDKGWTQERLAREAGLSKSFLSDVENDKTRVSGDNLLKISEVLGASLDFLMKGKSGGVSEETDYVEIPAYLSQAAEELGISFRETLMLLDIDKSIVARRSSRIKRPMKVEDWKQLYNRIKNFME
jgi:transcriptional regulator with XRE-family HTH domain